MASSLSIIHWGREKEAPSLTVLCVELSMPNLGKIDSQIAFPAAIRLQRPRR